MTTKAQQYLSSLEARKQVHRQAILTIEATQKDAQEFFGIEVEDETAPKTRKYTKQAAKPAKRNGKSRKGSRRSSEDIKKMQASVFTYLKANPGAKSGAISAALKIDAAELAVPIRKLLAAKQVTKKGERGGTQYFAKGGKRS